MNRTAGGVTTNFLDDGNQVLLEQQGGSTTATYTYGNALLRKDGEYPLFDGLGSERTVTNSSQAVQGTVTYDGFGQTVATSGSSTDPYMFAATSGYRNDGDAGLMLVGARYYDAQVGRFITRDTDLSQKPYLYCDGNPINTVDPSGHVPEWLRDMYEDLKGPVKNIVKVGLGIGVVISIYPSIHQVIVDWNERWAMQKMYQDWNPIDDPYGEKKLAIGQIIGGNYSGYLHDIGQAGGKTYQTIYR